MSDQAIDYTWVIGHFTGEDAKRIKALASERMGYISMEQDKSSISAAFRRANDSPVPSHLIVVTDSRQIEILEAKRNGIYAEPKKSKELQKIDKLFLSSKNE